MCLLLTAIHSLRSSPSGNMTACLKFPLPSVASACLSSSYWWEPSGMFFLGLKVLDERLPLQDNQQGADQQLCASGHFDTRSCFCRVLTVFRDAPLSFAFQQLLGIIKKRPCRDKNKNKGWDCNQCNDCLKDAHGFDVERILVPRVWLGNSSHVNRVTLNVLLVQHTGSDSKLHYRFYFRTRLETRFTEGGWVKWGRMMTNFTLLRHIRLKKIKPGRSFQVQTS